MSDKIMEVGSSSVLMQFQKKHPGVSKVAAWKSVLLQSPGRKRIAYKNGASNLVFHPTVMPPGV